MTLDFIIEESSQLIGIAAKKVKLNLFRKDEVEQGILYIKKYGLESVHHEVWLEASYEIDDGIQFRSFFDINKGVQLIRENLGVQKEILHIHLEEVWYEGEFVIFEKNNKTIISWKSEKLEPPMIS